MSPTSLALLGYAGWTLILLVALLTQRSVLVLGGRPANAFTPTGEDISPLGARLARAHLNCVENLPVVAAVAGVAWASEQTALTDPLATVLLAARIVQSAVHVASTAVPAVLVRFGAQLVQIAILTWWIVQLASA